MFAHSSVYNQSVCVFMGICEESTDLCVLALPPCAVCKLSCVYKGISVQHKTMVDESGNSLSAWVCLPDHGFTVCQSIYVYVFLDMYV